MAIQYRKITSPEPVIAYLTLTINRHLAKGDKVLWLVPGGSAIKIALEVARNLSSIDLKNLTVSLTDERFGSAGHADSNWHQLMDAGFSLPGASLQPVLTGGDIHHITEVYTKILSKCLEDSDFSIALGGIGDDGHTFGIKPHSPATLSNQIVVAYEWDDYVRLTPTLSLIEQLDEAVVYAVGEEKHPQIDKLNQKLSIDEQPAQLLKQLKKVTIFNDYKGDSV
jgi:6-phosphogluconolactonase/glucosamine-6-phosphate isomerase/deaminase